MGAALIAAASAGSPAFAQDIEAPDGDERPPEAVPPGAAKARTQDPDRVTWSVGATAVGKYISRGVAFSEEPSLQPFASARIALPELEGGALTVVTAFVGTWNSIQSGGPGLGQANDGPVPGWYEADIYTGVALTFRERFTVSLAWYRYISPADSFTDYDDFEMILRFDDTQFWKGRVPLDNFTLSPSLRMVQEEGQPLRDDALYVQPSLTPSFTVGTEMPVTVSVPLMIGLSDSFYRGVDGGNPDFGFFRTGVTLAISPIEAAPALSVNGGVDVWMLNDDVANGLDDNEFIGRIGARYSF
ncbi:hypothetical protein [uncultured Croceicoccus sp.]|uniref:hypothetical protein n=1 Tax=uncultured Croceicoccus sp. TaxID=1295329 RepID=UPI002636A117|nr:hypothetical protein [uncultured Croceicoccus sp.]